MRTFIYLILTCLISTGALFGAMNTPDPFPAFAIAFAAWALFIWDHDRRAKQAARKRYREQLFEDHMRAKLRDNKEY